MHLATPRLTALERIDRRAGLLTLTASKSSLLGHFRGPFFDAFLSESHKTALAVTNSVIGQCTSHYPTLPDTTCGRSSFGRRSWGIPFEFFLLYLDS
jgi:hypothetical protein